MLKGTVYYFEIMIILLGNTLNIVFLKRKNIHHIFFSSVHGNFGEIQRNLKYFVNYTWERHKNVIYLI